MMLALGNKEAVELGIDGGASLVIRAGVAPIVDGVEEQRMRVGCGSATIGIFAKQWFGHVDEVVVVDDHITGVLTEHQAGRCLGMILELKREGLSILLSEQNLHFAELVSDRAYVLEKGQIRFSGTIGELARNETVRRAYLSV